MSEPSSRWTEDRLRGYVDTTESLTVEFKSYRALIAIDKKDKNDRIQEAARDVAAMANEQGGVILYGMEEAGDGPWRRAITIEDGFKREDKVSREWFLQTMRDHVHPLLSDLDAFDVRLGNSTPSDPRYALVVEVPQARGFARQTDDLMFFRRDGQGRHVMSVQEIIDVANRATKPRLDLSVLVTDAQYQAGGAEGKRVLLTVQFRINNTAEATSAFATITLGPALHVELNPEPETEWRIVPSAEGLAVARLVLASGSSRIWSPITPRSTHFADHIRLITPDFEKDLQSSRPVGLVRLDHEGGSSVYGLVYDRNATTGADRLRVVPWSIHAREGYLQRVGALPLFEP